MERPVVLPAVEIIAILQQRPEAMEELKQVVAERLQQQGASVQGDDITDEMLYTQIASDSQLRSSITTYLRARGYVSDLQLEEASARPEEQLHNETAQSLPKGLGRPDVIEPYRGTATSIAPSIQKEVEGESPITRSGNSRYGAQSREQPSSAATDEPQVLREPTPYNLRSLRDLYTQIPESTGALMRFGADVFTNRDSSFAARSGVGRDTPLDVPLGPDYVLGPGDALTIDVWGSTTQTITRSIDRDGHILLPDAGSVALAGLSLERAQTLIHAALAQQYRNAQTEVTVSRVRSVRVYVVGDVQRPGGYDISGLATPLSALYVAGGPTSVGSLRTLRHYRNDRLIEDIDLYEFLLHGLRISNARFESGDTLLVPAARAQVAISGAVKRPAIYELKGEEDNLATLIEDAGGLTAAASPDHIQVERIDAHTRRETLTLQAAKDGGDHPTGDSAWSFRVQDGDRIRIGPVLAFSQSTIYVAGHVSRPGRMAYTDGMRLTNVLRSYRDMLPEPAAHGEVIRLVPPDLHVETIDFNLPDVMVGRTDLNLQPFDTIRIFGRYQLDAPKVTITGEVQRPGTFPLSSEMTAAQLVRMAGGFRRDAVVDTADLTSYTVSDQSKVTGSLMTVRIGAAVAGTDPGADVQLKAGDVLTIRQITGWNDIGQSITVEGQVNHPGTYGFTDGERLSSVLRRAGGFRESAYPDGALLVREQVRELEEKSRQELIRQIETNAAAARLSPNLGSGDTGATLQLIKTQQDEVLTRLRNEPPSGRLVVHISADIDSWANTPADIEVRRNDVLTIPKRPGFVLVTGQVYNATALTFTPGKTAGWYLRRAGGTNTTANRKEIFVIQANGIVIGRHSGGVFGADVLATRMGPGDVIVVPQKVLGSSLFWRNLLTAAQLASSVAITTAVAAL